MKYFVCIWFLFVSTQLHAQFYNEEEQGKKFAKPLRAYFVSSFHFSKPDGKFDTESSHKLESGYANNSIGFDFLRAGYLLNESWLLYTRWSHTTYEVNENSLNEFGRNFINVSYVGDVKSKWISNGLYLGLGYNISGEKSDLNFKAALGFLSVTSPEIHYSQKYSWLVPVDNHFIQQKLTRSNLAFSPGIQYRRYPYKRFLYLISIDYTVTTLSYRVEYYENNRFIDIISWKQPFATFNIATGIGYRF